MGYLIMTHFVGAHTKKIIKLLNLAGDSDSSNRSVLDAFFLGKAVAEALNERIESTVGEILSTVGRLQAEQQKQVQDFQVWSSLNWHYLVLDK